LAQVFRSLVLWARTQAPLRAVSRHVAGLDQLPSTGAYVVALPMKIKGGSGGPLRIIAWVPKG